MKALVTGCAGFIGSRLTATLLKDGWDVVGIDNLDPYYDPKIKEHNLQPLLKRPNFTFISGDINDSGVVDSALKNGIDVVVHLAAKAGVRPSFRDPASYVRVNIEGTIRLLETCRKADVKRVVFASSSSVYGRCNNTPFKEDEPDLRPLSPYGITKLQGEEYCRFYWETYGIETNALRFFTVYGPGQRPDMAIHKFIRNMLFNKPINMYGDGESYRDYTHIDDIISGLRSAMERFKGFRCINLGSGRPIKLKEMIDTIAEVVGKRPIINRLPMPQGDMPGTLADIGLAKDILGYSPKIGFREGVEGEVMWIKELISCGIIKG